MKRNSSLRVLAIIALICLAFGLGHVVAAGEWKVEVVSGDRSTVLTGADAAAMKAHAVNAAFLRSTGRIDGPSAYTVIPMDAILAQVGGINPEQAIRVTARDGYQMVYSFAQVNGGVFTYDDKGNTLRVGGPSMLLAFESERDSADKLPRIIYGRPDSVVITDGHFWAKAVAKIEVIKGVEDWQVNLSGTEKVWLDRATFESIVTCPVTPHPVVSWSVAEKDGSTSTYEGAPLWVVLSMIDGGDAPDGHYVFNDELAETGYTIKVTSKDGLAAELDSKSVARNNDIIVAYLKNGEYLAEGDAPLRLVGDLPTKKHSVKAIAAIQIVGN
ncbi:MAG: hypothetical protein KA063_03725 [Firmicutes bacterium]|nr:hypothetical protein [Bacillota bacterium]